MLKIMRRAHAGLLLMLAAAVAQGSERVPMQTPAGSLQVPADNTIYFLQFGAATFEPAKLTAGGRAVPVVRGEPIVVAPFQRLAAVPWKIDASAGAELHVESPPPTRDAFWDQVITVDEAMLRDPPRFRVAESGEFGSAIASAARPMTAGEIAAQQQSQSDPIIPAEISRAMSWNKLASAAFPLDFQKVLIASFNDPNPAFAFENGQWLTTWLSRDLPKWNKEDHWFAPALLIGRELIRPAPLSAKARFATLENGLTVPLFTIEWKHGGATIRQSLFSMRPPADAAPKVFVRFELTGVPTGAKLAIGMGRRPNVHWWDDKSRPRTPIPFFTLEPKYRLEGRRVIDSSGHVILESAGAIELQPLGPFEMLATLECDGDGVAHVVTPQSETTAGSVGFTIGDHERARAEFDRAWTAHLRGGATVELPSPEWMRRIDIWRSQVACITRVHYQNKERLSYGAYFYQYYFGIEEGWPVVALAQWGIGNEAQRQARIMLDAENLDKANVHHQSRNGAAAWCAAEVARLTNDREFLKSIAPSLLECAAWTRKVCDEAAENRSPVTRGLLPPHIYGGDVRDPATSLYATAACWRGMESTADGFLRLGDESLDREGARLRRDADALRARIGEVIEAVADRSTTPPFVPFALELPSLGGKHEGPHERITATRFGNYWNLFAPSFLELKYRRPDGSASPNDWIFDYAAARGGHWAGLPRFYNGLDAAYAIGNIAHLLERSAADTTRRHRALAALQSFFLHAASRNGYTIPEVAGLFPYRLDRAAFEQAAREAPWCFGMYDADRYLEGHLFCTEPLGAAAGAGLSMIRDALVYETRDARGNTDGGLILLPTVPEEWFDEGKQIILRDFPTRFGKISATIRSHIDSRREIVMEHRFEPFDSAPGGPLPPFKVRFAPRGRPAIEVRFDPADPAPVRGRF